MKGNEAIAEAAIQAGCRHYFGYPITPQTEIMHYMAKRMPEVGGTMVQAESEIAAINMVYGAAAAGARVLTTSSSPGISLKQEGFSYIAGAELPAVVVNIVRAGPGLGGILPAQADYFQATKGGGHGDYRNLVLAPSSVQELYALTMLAFDLADRYRILTLILGDGALGQMMEPVTTVSSDIASDVAVGHDGETASGSVERAEFASENPIDRATSKPWAVCGTRGLRPHNTVQSIYIEADDLETVNRRLQDKYARIAAAETRVEMTDTDDAEVLIVAFGTCSRICASAMRRAREAGMKVGLIRPVTLWPFPSEAIARAAAQLSVRSLLVVEMNCGQMVEDVRLAVNGLRSVHFYGRSGGNLPQQDEILSALSERISSDPAAGKAGS